MASTNPLPAFSFRHALAWSAATTLVLALVTSVLRWTAPALVGNLLVLGAVSVTVYGAAALLLVGTRGGAAERLRVLGFARAPAWLLATAVVLGVAVHGPADIAVSLVDRFFPRSDAELLDAARRFAPPGLAARAAVLLLVAGLVPLTEEAFFRGALFARLRLPGSRLSALAVSGFFFVVCHGEPRFWAGIAIVAFALGLVRALGRGLWPCVLLHASFNATSLVLAFLRHPDAPIEREPPIALALGGTIVSLAVLGLLMRQVDLERREFA